MALAEYNRKRRFRETPEPRGRMQRGSAKQLHFVVQKHDASHLHYDFRLELDGVLKSWAVPKGPSLNPADKRLAMETEDHPMSYIDFEGKIPEGNYGAGDVIVWDTGLYASSETADPEEGRKRLKSGYYKGELKFILLGEKLQGAYTLVKMRNGKEDNAWLLIKERDEFAKKKDITKDVSSVLSEEPLPRDGGRERSRVWGRTKATLSGASPSSRKRPAKSGATRKSSSPKRNGSKKALLSSVRNHDKMPHDVKPMLAKLFDKPFDEPGWFFEVKWDGYRAIAEVEDDEVRLYSRHQQPFNDVYPPIVDALRSVGHGCVLDGEIVALKGDKADFHTLQGYSKRKAPLQYVVFDILYLDGRDLRSLPLRERKEVLREMLPRHPQLAYSDHVEGDGIAFFRTVQKSGIEGMVAKDSMSTYREGVRSDAWCKIKNIREQEAIIVGFTEPRGSRKNLGALVLGAYTDGKLTYIGHSGGGFTQKELRDMCKTLSKIKVKASPFDKKVPVNAPVTWVKPKYVCSVQFTEWTPEGHMRHPIYRGLRVDKDPSEVSREMPATMNGVKKKIVRKKRSGGDIPELTHTDKVFWPKEGYTKGDVLAYYDKIAPTLLPYLKDRPMVLNRHPNGFTKPGFFQKDTSDLKLPDFVETTMVHSDSNDKEIRYVLVNNKETLLYIANLGCIELNPWESRVGSIRKPDYYIIDIDPNGRPFADVVKVAQTAHDILKMACEFSCVKTSGKTGLHIYVPLGGKADYDTVRTFSEGVCKLINARQPKITSLERNPKNRKGLIYLDYLRNAFGQTAASAYSIRPFAGATVSTPLEWSEVKKGLDPSRFTIKTIWKRLEKKGDLWKPMLTKKVDLKESIRCLNEELEK